MKIHLELELDALYYEHNDGKVVLEGLTFPNCTQNLMPYLSSDEIKKAQEEVQSTADKTAVDKAAAIVERREMRGE